MKPQRPDQLQIEVINPDAPLPREALELVASLLLDAVMREEQESDPPQNESIVFSKAK